MSADSSTETDVDIEKTMDEQFQKNLRSTYDVDEKILIGLAEKARREGREFDPKRYGYELASFNHDDMGAHIQNGLFDSGRANDFSD